MICLTDLNRYRSQYVKNIIKHDKGEVTPLENEVIKSISDHELLADNLNKEFEEDRTYAEKLADKIASFGGSWSFILIFAGTIVL